jgi:methoxymalonate biosynthesis acyl carrier protein
MADLANIQGQLLAFLRQRQGVDEALDAQTDLIRTGWLDSLLLVDLVLHIEQSFGVVLAMGDVTPANFRTVASLAEQVRRHLDSQLRRAA